jgi:membrane protease subunit HflK
MRRIVGDSSIDEVLMSRRKEIEDMAVEEIEGFLERYRCGIHIVEVNLMRVDPPTAVKAAFDAVNQAKQVRDQIINEAEAKKNRELIPAEGKKERMIAEANGYRRERINKAQGDAKAFLAILEEYQKAKEITRRRLYLETLGRILPRCGKLYLIDKEQKGLLPILTLPERTGGSAR